MSGFWHRIPKLPRAAILLVCILTLIALARTVLERHFSRTTTLFAMLVLMTLCSSFLLVRRRRENTRELSSKDSGRAGTEEVSSAVMVFLGSIMVVGVGLFGSVCFDPGSMDPSVQILVRMASGIIAFVCLTLAVVCFAQVVALNSRRRNRPKNANEKQG